MNSSVTMLSTFRETKIKKETQAAGGWSEEEESA